MDRQQMDDHDELSLAYADVGVGHGLLVRLEGEALTKCFHRTEETIGVASRADCGSEHACRRVSRPYRLSARSQSQATLC